MHYVEGQMIWCQSQSVKCILWSCTCFQTTVPTRCKRFWGVIFHSKPFYFRWPKGMILPFLRYCGKVLVKLQLTMVNWSGIIRMFHLRSVTGLRTALSFRESSKRDAKCSAVMWGSLLLLASLFYPSRRQERCAWERRRWHHSTSMYGLEFLNSYW